MSALQTAALVSLFVVLFHAQVVATTYHVDSVGGDDAAVGTSPEAPFRTLDRVNRITLQPGDQVLLRAGSTFEGQLKPLGRGEPGKPLLVSMYGQGPMPRIDGRGRVDAAVHLLNTEYVTVESLEVSNRGAERGQGRRGILIELNDFGTAREITVRRNRVTDVNGSLFKKERGGGGGIHFRNGGTKTPSRFDGLTISHNHLVRTDRNGITGSSGYVDRAKWFPNLRVSISDNLLEEVPGDGIVPVGCEGAIVRGNVVRNGSALLKPEHSAAAGIWPWSCDDTLIEYNEVSQHRAALDGQGFDADWNCRNTLIQYNYSHHNDGGFLLVCNDGGAKLPYSAGNTGTVVRFNVSFNDGLREVDERTGPSARAAAININGTVDGALIHGNLIIVPAKASPRVDDALVIATKWGGFPRNVRITGNVFVTQSAARFQTEPGIDFAYADNVLMGPVRPPAEAPHVHRLVGSDTVDTGIFGFPGPGLEPALHLLGRLIRQ